MLTVALQQFLAKKLRGLLTVVGFGVCVNLYIVVTTVLKFVNDDLDLQVQRFTGRLILQSRGHAGLTGVEWPPISSAVPMAAVADLLDSPFVIRQESSAIAFGALAPPPFPSAPPEALLVGVEDGREAVFLGDAPALLGRNRFPARGPRPPVILGVLAARYFAPYASQTAQVPTPIGPISLAAVGSTVEIRGRAFDVIGILEPETNQLIRSCVVVPLDDARALLGQTATVNAALITPRRASDVEALQAEVQRRYPALMVVTDKQLQDNVHRLLERTNQLFSVVRWTAVTVAALLITIVMFVAVLERTRELGTLRAIGAPARAIMTMIISEAFVIAALGGAVGVPLSRLVIQRALGPDAASIRSFRIESQAVVLLAGFGLVAALLPALRAVRVDPLVALRYE